MRFKFSTQRMTVFQKILISIGAFCVVFAAYFAWGYSQIKPLMPSEGYVYPSAPTLTGVYDCCGNVPNTAYSKVDGVQINCAKPGFGMGGSTRLGDKRTACWLTNLNGKTVSVERKMLPISGGSFFPSSLFQGAYVVKITDVLSHEVVFERTDAQLRGEWISETIRGILITDMVLGLLVGVVVLLKLIRSSEEN